MITDWDDAYTNGAYIEGGSLYPARWAQAAAAFRECLLAEGRAKLDIAYGPDDRNRFDLFLPEGEPRGLAVFVHGGYWLAFDKSSWSHLAAGALAHGFAVAMPSYILAPQASIADITRQIGAAIAAAAAHVGGPITLAGHSAGGHLVSRMACTDAPLPEAVTARLSHIVSISGLHDLRPLLHTKMNEALKLDAAMAMTESAALLTPRGAAVVSCIVGADERPEFRRQNDLLVNIWTGMGVRIAGKQIASRHHFNVIEDLADPESELTHHFVGLVKPE